MNSYKIIPHTADIKIKVTAKSLTNLFINALEGMNDILSKDHCQKIAKYQCTKYLKISSPDTTSLLIDFLNEVLTRSYIDNAIFCKVSFKRLDNCNLEAEIHGQEIKEFEEDIKAISYHGAEIIQNKKGLFQVTIILDI